MGTWCNCIECVGETPEPTDEEFMTNWLIDRENELKMNGLREKEAKEKAMEDWHTYQAPNGTELRGTPEASVPAGFCAGTLHERGLPRESRCLLERSDGR